MSENEDAYGRKRFKLGVVELAVVTVAISAALWLFSQQWQANTAQQGKMVSKIAALTTQVAVLTDHIATLNQQLADVPTLTRQMAKVEATQDEYGRRITALEDHRGVKVKGWEH